jgi:hypothetical protein
MSFRVPTADKPMTDAEFEAFVHELASFFAHTRHHWVLAVFPPGAFENEARPMSAGNMPRDAQAIALRNIASGLEGGAVEFIRSRIE